MGESSASILTGRVASHHDVGMDSERLPAGLPTVAERFSEAGDATAALSTVGHVSAGSGLNRGFDRFTWLTTSTALNDLLSTDGAPFDGNRREAAFTPAVCAQLRDLGYLDS